MKQQGSAAPQSKTPQMGPDGKPETPKQKVERLRAQARAARMTQSSSGMDRVIEVGRRVANKAHKGMVYSLIIASGKWLSLFRTPCPGKRKIPILAPDQRANIVSAVHCYMLLDCLVV
jgi:hypothetical protein